MSEPEFTAIFTLLNSGTTESEIADRIDRDEMYWHDVYGRVARAGATERTMAHAALSEHLAMKGAAAIANKETSKSMQSLARDSVESYWLSWKELGQQGANDDHALARGGFRQELGVDLDTPLPKTDGSHISDQLAYLKQAANEFWAGVDPNDKAKHPDNKTVVAWLRKHGYSKTLADSAASIIRPKWAAKGRKPK